MKTPEPPSRSSPAAPPGRPSAFGLALKITLPFVALFALLLIVLGVVLAREIISDLEDRVEREQRFVLELIGQYGVDQERLAQLHKLETGSLMNGVSQSSGTERPSPSTEYAIFDPNGNVLSTLSDSGAERKIIEELKHERGQADFQPEGGAFRRKIVTLNEQRWLVLFKTYAPHGMKRDVYHLYPYSEIEQSKTKAIFHIVGLGSAGLLAVALLGLVVAYWVALPVRRLAAAARQITSTGLNEPIPAVIEFQQAGASHDEIEELALAFKTMLDSLRRSQQDLLKNERLASTGKLAASVAHEIRNPLTSLRMTIQMMQQRSNSQAPQSAGEGDSATREGYTIVLREIDRLALSVEELLTFARPRPPRREPVDLNQLCRDVLKFLEHQLVHARIASDTDLAQDLPAWLPLDANKIRQLLVNLILNAQQAIIRDGKVTVGTRWNAELKQVTLTVSDTGPGISEEVRDKVFELFVSTKDGGGGFGLTIAKQIAEEHGGSIRFETSPKGTTFFVVLAAE